MVKIVQRTAPILREQALDVPIEDIKSPKIKKVIKEMKKVLDTQDDGVAIAAPQIGHSLKIFVVSHKIFDILREIEEDPKKVKEEEKSIKKINKDLVFINPQILRLSREKQLVDEGCLSVRWLYGKVSRSKKAKLEAYNEQGQKFETGASGLLAQIFQHETDHLKGILFIDKAKNLEEIPPQK